jgi:uncharacterized protein DUF2628
VTVYSVYEPASDDDDVAARAEKIAFVKDGFSWPAFLVPVLWLLYQRMWIELAAFLVIIGGLQWALGGSVEGLELAGWITLAITVLFGFEANDLRGAMLQRRGFRFTGVAAGRDRTQAERSFFTAWLPEQARTPRPIAPPQKASASRGSARSSRRGGDDVIGLFPQG